MLDESALYVLGFVAAYNLELYGLAIELNRPDFLRGLAPSVHHLGPQKRTKSTPMVEM